MDSTEARARFAAARVARLATADAAGVPHLVPVTFAVAGDEIVFAVDHKPKSTLALKRLANIAANPAVSFLVDHYDDDWDRLWWVRADGEATVTDRTEPVDWLRAKYPQYREHPPQGPVVITRITVWRDWSST
ncbi:TIGR03668 family PPOX class F420-dependent oxidoreductase [Amycolatopsis sp. NPDC059657]|uniref:TIGR03668 family PPOX class F420-dependent oxidoreductase n=1 Tax=Amycolatopsis sp. NPDC059657 TaxID=3346899 RepID=UPI00366C9EA1